ncbi:MAG: ATP-binding protein [Fibrobacterota bacterium]
MVTEQADLKNIIEALPVGVMVIGPDGIVKNANRLACEWLGVPLEKLMVLPLHEAVRDPELAKFLRDGALTASSQGRAVIVANGRSLQVSYQNLSVNTGMTEETLLLLEDITRYRQLESLKSEFVSIVIHKLRNPLTTVTTSLAMLRAGAVKDLPPQAREILDLCHSDITRLTGLINDLRQTFLIDTGLLTREMEYESFPLIHAVQRAADEIFIGPYARERLVVEGDLKAMTHADFDKTKKIFFHLLKNALNYSSLQSPVTLCVTQTEEMLLVTVTDQGVGIPDDEAPLVFDRYFRGRYTQTVPIEGNGLGLYIARAYIQAMRGSIYCESRESTGTVFYATFPTA